ncbi:MAG: hypothetical protein U0939_22150 [Pirellulales bacterium]
MPMRYARRLTRSFSDLLLPPGPLHFLVRDFRRWIDGDSFALDLQLREGDKLMYYHGTTVLLTVAYDGKAEEVALSAASAYGNVPGYQDLMRRWPVNEHEKLLELVPEYLRSAVAFSGPQFYRNGQEGYWQNRLALAFGPDWKRGMDWLIIDREAVIGFNNDAERSAIQDPIQQKYLAVRASLQQEDPSLWGKPDNKGLGAESDFLALGPDGELFVIELKHGSNASGIYWGRLQVAVYGDIFRSALDEIANDIRELTAQKVELGLLPNEALPRIPSTGFRTVIPVLIVAEPNDASSCWERLRDVLGRCPEANALLVEVRNKLDPAPIPRVDRKST